MWGNIVLRSITQTELRSITQAELCSIATKHCDLFMQQI
jgi:hypothetical protein